MTKDRIERRREPSIDWLSPDAMRKYFDRGNLTLRQRKYAETIEEALKCLKSNPVWEVRHLALQFMATASQKYELINPEKQNEIKQKLREYLQTIDLLTQGIEEKILWMTMLEEVFADRLLEPQLKLAEAVFKQTLTEEIKSYAANTYLLVATRRLKYENIAAEPEKVRGMAEFVLEKDQHTLSDHVKMDQAVFHTLIINLVKNKLLDLVPRALEIRCPDPSDPILSYLSLHAKYESGSEDAYELMLKMPLPDIKHPGFSGMVLRELLNLRVRILRQRMEAKQIDAERSPQMEKDSLLAQVMASPGNKYPSVVQLIRRVRETLFLGFRSVIKSRNCESRTYVFPETPQPYDNLKIKKSFVLLIPETGALEVYLTDGNEEKALKFTYRVLDQEKISPAGDHRPDGPLIYEYLSLLALFALIEGKEQERHFQNVLNNIENAIFAEATKLLEAQNRNYWEQLEKEINGHEAYKLKQIESDSRAYLARRTIEYGGLLEHLRSVVLGLEATDTLSAHIKDVEVVLPSDLNPDVEEAKIVKISGIKYFFHLITHGNHIIYVDVKSLDDISIRGAVYPEDGLAIKLVKGLFYEVAVKLSVLAEKREKAEDHTGYVVDLEKDEQDPAVDAFSKICRRVVLARFRKEGVLNDNWYTRELTEDGEEIYRSLADQSLSAKKELLRQGKGGQLFVPLEPVGTIRRLPVRTVREGRELKIAPYKRNPIRELQQKLFGDPRILPEYYGLYVITTFSNGKKHVYRYSLAKKEEEILEGKMIEKMEEEIRSGRFNRPENDYRELFAGTKKKERDFLVRQLKAGALTIESQTAEIFHPIQSTYHRPPMASISALLEKGFKLE